MKDKETKSANEKALEALLSMMGHWQKSSSSPSETRESMRHVLHALQEKLGVSQPLPMINIKELYGLITNPAHFTPKERELVRLVWKQIARLKQISSGNTQIAKTKRRSKINKNFI